MHLTHSRATLVSQHHPPARWTRPPHAGHKPLLTFATTRAHHKGTARAPLVAAPLPGIEDGVSLDFYWSTTQNGNAQEVRRNRGGILARAFVLAVEENFQLFLKITSSTVLFGRFEGVHGRAVEGLKCSNEL